ncbi:MAG: N-acetylmuramoyl-L-alanine amidase [Synergistes sp.]|nr:N-acetylmuramoyl-L-alanine amidase [Synergistes sp.]
MKKISLLIVLLLGIVTLLAPQLSEAAAAKNKKSASAIQRSNVIIVLDAGHGGHANGAMANGLVEKDLNLQYVKKIGKVLQNRGYKVKFTRTKDKSLELKDRAAFANKLHATLFVSIHCNAMPDPKIASGMEFFIDSPYSAEQLAQQQKAVTPDTKKITSADVSQDVSPASNDVSEDIYVSTDINNADDSKSSEYVPLVVCTKADKDTFITKVYKSDNSLRIKKSAACLDQIYDRVSLDGFTVRKIRQRAFHVLHNTTMPSILIELGYITDSEEAEKLTQPKYMDKLCKSIASGIIDYISIKNKKLW